MPIKMNVYSPGFKTLSLKRLIRSLWLRATLLNKAGTGARTCALHAKIFSSLTGMSKTVQGEGGAQYENCGWDGSVSFRMHDLKQE